MELNARSGDQPVPTAFAVSSPSTTADRRLRILVTGTNLKGKAKLVHDDGTEIASAPVFGDSKPYSDWLRRELPRGAARFAESGRLILEVSGVGEQEYDAIFTTSSQIQKVSEDEAPIRVEALAHAAQNAHTVPVMDGSPSAAGGSGPQSSDKYRKYTNPASHRGRDPPTGSGASGGPHALCPRHRAPSQTQNPVGPDRIRGRPAAASLEVGDSDGELRVGRRRPLLAGPGRVLHRRRSGRNGRGALCGALHRGNERTGARA